jgi:hypothetical protein
MRLNRIATTYHSAIDTPWWRSHGAGMTALALAIALATGGRSVAAAGAPVTAAPANDPLFTQAYVDIDEWRDAPVRHRYVHGGFKGTDLKFSYYFPAKRDYRGHFFQYLTPVPDSETSSQQAQGGENMIAFAVASGAYFVETNGGGASANAGPAFRADPTIGGYRANAAAARYSRIVAAGIYGARRPYGYIFGGSGGAYRTLGGIENTHGVWDGAVPFVLGSPMASPSNFTIRMHAMRVLRDKFPGIVDALEPGGSGNPFAGLNDEQAAALREATRMGFPLQSWFGWKTMGVHAFTAIYGGVLAADPTYFDDFWTKPGYLGFDPPASLSKARLQFRTTVRALLSADEAEAHGVGAVRIPGTARGTADLAWESQIHDGSKRPVAIQLTASPPDVGFLGGDLLILSGAAKGKRLALREITGDATSLGVVDLATLAALRPGDDVQVDNSNFLAAQTYHRHQVPRSGYPVWDQFVDADGKPRYPQRRVLLGPLFTKGAAGTVPTGAFEGKMILVESLWDREAFPWQADWYRQQVRSHLGGATDDHFRVWMTDHALHGGVEDPTRIVSYIPILQQALRDLSAWVERGTVPPASTIYRVDDGQVSVPPDAPARKGIQPVVGLTVAGGAKRIDIIAGQTVEFAGTIAAPPGAGIIVAAEWDFDGAGTFTTTSAVASAATTTKVAISHRFDKPGTYFPVLRGTAQRTGDRKTPFARIQNLDRVRVVVSAAP